MNNSKQYLFDHEKLDVYQLTIEYVAWVYSVVESLSGHNRHARDQLLRPSQSIPQNIAEGNGKRSLKDRNRFFDIARGSALECASIHDILLVGGALAHDVTFKQKRQLHRVVSMLTKLVLRNDSYVVHEEPAEYGANIDDDHEHRFAEHEHDSTETTS